VCMSGDGDHAVDAVLSVEERGRARRSLPSHGLRAGGQQRSRDSGLATETALHQSLHQGDVKVNVTPFSSRCYLLHLSDNKYQTSLSFLAFFMLLDFLFRSTLPSRSNNIEGKCPSVSR